MKILIINGPNLNLIGLREPDIYGSETYESMCNYIKKNALDMNIDIDIMQSNIEGEIIGFIHNSIGKYDGIVINPGAYTHYSIAIYDAIKAVPVPAVEVHLSNINQREEFRRKSVTAPGCIGVVMGFGKYGYIMGMSALKNRENI